MTESTDLFALAQRGDVEQLARLLEAGADPNEKRGNAFTALHAAAMHGHTASCRVLLDHGADPNAQTDPQGYAPIHSASFADHIETVHLLMQRGASTTLRNYRNETPLDTALRTDALRVVAHLSVPG